MTDKDTYQYQDDDAVKSSSYEDYIDDSASQGGPQGLMNNPKLIGFASVVVGIYLVGYLVSVFYEAPASKPQQTVATQPVSAPKDDQMIQLNSTVSKQQTLIQQLSSNNQRLNIAINDLKKEVITLRNNQNKVADSQSAVEKNDLDRLSNQLADLRDRVIVTEKTIKAMQPKPADKPLAQFYLRGIIEGRAWISDPNGANKTIRLGDSLPDYGKITGIFPDAGFVMTESKRKITFSKGDS